MKTPLLIVTLLFGTLYSGGAARALECAWLPRIMDVFTKYHYSINERSPEVRQRNVNLFLKYIDGGKTILYQSDYDQLSKKLRVMIDLLDSNPDCGVLTEVGQLLIKRAEENQRIVKEIVDAKDFKLDESATYQSDPKKRSFAKDEKEKRAQLTAGVHTQIASLMAGDVKFDKAKTQLLKRYELLVKRMKELTKAKLTDMVADSFAHALDPHSDYMSPETRDEFNISMNLSLEGIGVSLSSEDGFTTVEEIVPGGSAYRANALKPKDRITKVAQDGKDWESIIDMDLSDVVKRIRGKKGTKVRLNVVRKKGGNSETFEVTLVRDKVDMKDRAAKVTYLDKKVNGMAKKIAVVDLPSFYGGGQEKNSRSCYEDMRQIVKEAVGKKVDGMILDLSQNGGGLLQDAVKIAGLFIEKGPIVATLDSRKNRDILSDEDPEIVYKGPLVVLTSRQSASASEIFAGAMKDYKRALIVGGDKTFGKGTVQVLSPLPGELGAMKLTTSMFYLPGGKSTQNIGVAGDIALPSVLDEDDFGEASMDYALPPATTPVFLNEKLALGEKPQWKPIPQGLISKLREASSKRVPMISDFKDIMKDNDDYKKNGGIVRVSQILNRSEKDKVKRKKIKERASTSKGRQEIWMESPYIQESISIMEDWIKLDPEVALSRHR